jgi:SEC-C motif-containing protein
MAKRKPTSPSILICWCGSDLPYRDCHHERDKQIPFKPHEIQEKFQKEFSKRYCMHPQLSSTSCSQQLVAAHSVSRSSNLNAIAENGHVMQFRPSFQSMLNNDGLLMPELIGVNRASTFTGFCHRHDSSTFEPIDQPVTALTDGHIFLVAYRALCRELFTKTAVSAEGILKTARQMDKGKDRAAQEVIQDFNNYREMGLEAGLRDLRAQKAEYDQVLLHKNYERMSYYVVTLDHAPPIVCTIGFTPEVDFHGTRLQRLDHPAQHADTMTCSIIKTAGGAAIVFAWLSERNGACSGLISSFDKIKAHHLPSAIVRLVFEHGENVFFSQTWWNDLDDPAKETIGGHANSFSDKAEDCLKPDGSLQIFWSVVDRKKVIR